MKLYVEHEDRIILFSEKSRDYLIPVRDNGGSGIFIRFCPWCGKLIAGDKAQKMAPSPDGIKKRDILDELAKSTITAEQAERAYDEIMDSAQVDFAEALGLSEVESTAFGHGVRLPELARWRQNGWPTRCVACGGTIDIPKYGWMAKEIRPEHHVLEHITCPPKSR